jgi:hypothetical protein
MFLLVSNDAFAITEESKESFRLGLGFGLTYGLIGTSVEIIPLDNLAISGSLGLGLSGIGSPVWSLGARIYALNKNVGLDPHLSAYYGKLLETNKGFNRASDRIEVGVLRGYSFGPGIEYIFKNRTSIDFEWLYLKSNDLEESGINNPWTFRFSFGVRF